ncbi:histone H3-like protein [Nosema granulosis]|uniref:Histone H3-like protein n=1 Tax=Nosema granulosis TaxID=83296 RepID=A0A9P6L096_9MICR|nr:histone H3-like protein [Nosema granulosis]
MARTAMTKKSTSGKSKKVTQKEEPQKTKPKEKKAIATKKPVIVQGTPTRRRKSKQSLVLKEINYYQHSTNFLLSKRPFVRYVRSIVGDLAMAQDTTSVKFTAQSLDMLQDIFEAHITALMEAAYNCSRHAKRVTLYPTDLRLVNKIRGYGNI